MNKNNNNPSLYIFIELFFYILLILPLIAYINTVWLRFPNKIHSVLLFYILIIGVVFILSYEIKNIPTYTWLLLGYAVYRLVMVRINYKEENYATQFQYFSMALLVIIIYNTKFSDSFIKRTVSIFKVIAILAVVASIIQIFYPNFLDAFQYDPTQKDLISDNIYTDRRASIFGFVDLNELGLSFIPFASVVIGHLLRNHLKSYIYLIIAVGITSLLSNGRYIMVGFLLLVIQYVFYNRNKFKGYFKLIIISIIVILIFYYVLNILGYDLLDWYHERLLAEGSIEQTTRYKAWGNFIYFFPKYFLWGTGVPYNTLEIARASARIGSSQIHVGYLAHLVSFGIVGSFFYFGFLFMLTKSLLKTAKITNYWGSFFAFLIFLWSQTTLVLHSIFFTGLIFALIFDKYYYDKYREYIGQTIESVVTQEYDKINK